MMQDHDVFNVSFFNQPYLKDKVEVSEEIAVYGKWDAKRKGLTGMKILSNKSAEDFAPIYHVNKAVRQSVLIELIKQAFLDFGDQITEILPLSLIENIACWIGNPRCLRCTFLKIPKRVIKRSVG